MKKVMSAKFNVDHLQPLRWIPGSDVALHSCSLGMLSTETIVPCQSVWQSNLPEQNVHRCCSGHRAQLLTHVSPTLKAQTCL